MSKLKKTKKSKGRRLSTVFPLSKKDLIDSIKNRADIIDMGITFEENEKVIICNFSKRDSENTMMILSRELLL